MKSTAQSPEVPREVEALRASLDARLLALEKALADPKQHAALESMILDLARMATEEAHATARHAVLDIQNAAQQAVAAARTEGLTALENAKSALQQAETMLAEQRRATETAREEAAGSRRELEAIKERLEQGQSALDTERADAAKLLHARSELESSLSATRRELDASRAELHAAIRDLDAARRELESARYDSDSQTQALSESRAAQQEALKAAHDAARSAEERSHQAIRERDALQNDCEQLQRQLHAAEAAIREAVQVNRELQAAHEARDAAEVLDTARETPRNAELDVETVVDLTAITNDEEWQRALEQRTRTLELALRDAEVRADSAELELERHRRSARIPAAPADTGPAVQPERAAPQTEQFRGPARGARRVAFKNDVPLQIDGNPGKLVDLSVTGAQVLTPSAINPNRLITLTLPTPQGALACKAKVVWSRLEPRAGKLWYRAGVQFTNVDQHAVETFFTTNQS